MNFLTKLAGKGNLPAEKTDALEKIRAKLVRGGHIPLASKFSSGGICFLLLDYSSSMAGEKLRQAKAGAKDFAAEAVERGYKVGLVKFSTFAELVCEPTNNLSDFAAIVDSLEVDYSTNMAQAVRIACDVLSDEGSVRAMVVVTDGKPDKKESTLAEVARAKEMGIDILTIGTDGADEEFLRQIATKEELARFSPSIAAFAKNIRLTAQDLRMLDNK